jgi:AraC-like DNA-binding protein
MGRRNPDQPYLHTGASPQRDAIPLVAKALRFSTDDFPEHKRVEAYREIYSRTITKHDIEPIGDGPFHFEASLCSLPGLGLATSSMSPGRRIHGRQHIEGDDFLLGIALSGGCIVEQRGCEAVIRKGEAVLLSAAYPANVVIAATARSISMRVPHSVFGSKLADLDRLSRRIPGTIEGLRLLTGYVGSIWNADVLNDPALHDIVVTHIHDLTRIALGAKGDARRLAEERGAAAARRAAILRAISTRSADPSLSANSVAVTLGITPRYVHLLLEETGRSFTHHLLERRLEKAVALLRDAQWGDRKISDIALEAGFVDLSYFGRAFRRHYGVTPSDIRYTARHPT